MRSNMWKRMMALACAGIMVAGSSNMGIVSVKAAEEAPALEALTVEEAPALEAFEVKEVKQEVYAAQENLERIVGTPNPRWFNKDYSTSYYAKVPIKSATADSIAANEGSINAVFDNDVESYWHSDYSGKNDVTGAPGAITGKNTVILTLNKPENINGITHTPRPSKANGIIQEFKVEVHISGTPDTEWVAPTRPNGNKMYFAAIGTGNYQKGIDEEFLFGKTIENVDKVKFIVTKAYSTGQKAFISASELGVIKDDQTVAINSLKVSINEEIRNASVYESQELKNALSHAQQICGKQDVTVSELAAELEAVKTAVQNSQKTFKDEYGTGHYLSDIRFKAEKNPSYEHTAMDKSCKDEPLKLNVDGQETEFIKGIGTHADNTIVYDLTGNNAGHKLFTARIGIQSAYNNDLGKVNFKVLMSKGKDEDADYKEVLNETDITMTNTKLIKIDITGATHLKLIVEHGSEFSNDHADWADAKLYTTLTKETGHPDLQVAMDAAQKELKKASTDYSASSREYVVDSYKNAEAVMADTTKTLDEVNVAKDQLNESMQALERVQYVVKVTGQESIQGPAGTEASVTAPEQAGQVFDYWENLSQEVVSPNKTYHFVITGNDTLTPVYRQETAQSAVQNSANIPSVTLMERTDGRFNLKYLVQLQMPKGSTLVETGLLWTNKEGGVPEGQFNLEGLKAGTVKVKKATRVNINYQYYMMLNGARKGMDIQARVYANIRNAEGNVETVYSNISNKFVGKLA